MLTGVRLSGPTASGSRVAGVEDSPAGKTRRKYTNLRWGGAVATAAARGVSPRSGLEKRYDVKDCTEIA